jgi:ADP-ribosyl-[dinitrogen reductase] hydrolase
LPDGPWWMPTSHPNPICLQANALYAMAIAHGIRSGAGPRELYELVVTWATEMEVEPGLMNAIRDAADAPPADYVRHQGWVLIAFSNALWQLLHAPTLEDGVVDTVSRGGDTDTNAALCGALLGAVHGVGAIPAQWKEKVLSCRPKAGLPNVHRPRPEILWPVDGLDLAKRLIAMK